MHTSGGTIISGFTQTKSAAVSAVLGLNERLIDVNLFMAAASNPTPINSDPPPLTNGFDTTADSEERSHGLQPLTRDRQRELRGCLKELPEEMYQNAVVGFKRAFSLPPKLEKIGDRITQERHAAWLEDFIAKVTTDSGEILK